MSKHGYDEEALKILADLGIDPEGVAQDPSTEIEDLERELRELEGWSGIETSSEYNPSTEDDLELEFAMMGLEGRSGISIVDEVEDGFMNDPEMAALSRQVDLDAEAEAASRPKYTKQIVDDVIKDLNSSKFGKSNGFFASKNVAKKLGFANERSFEMVFVDPDHPQSDVIDAYNSLFVLNLGFNEMRSFVGNQASQQGLHAAYKNLMTNMEAVSEKTGFESINDPAFDIPIAAFALKSYIKSPEFTLQDQVSKPSGAVGSFKSLQLDNARGADHSRV